MMEFTPPLLLRNKHIQSILSSIQPRKGLVRRKAKHWLANSEEHIIDCNGVRMQAFSNIQQQAKGLVQLIHGWEGSADSNYLVSAADTLYRAGYSVFRLNLRDHGDTHHLNDSLFNSTRMDEVLTALSWGQQQFEHRQNFLVGFSLGGNFALRTSADMHLKKLSFSSIYAICPVISPLETMSALNQKPRIYHDYFSKKWRQSLHKKLQFHPDLGYGERLKSLTTLDQMNQFFVPIHTEYDNAQNYLNAYAVIDGRLDTLYAPTHIIAANDDPIIHAAQFSHLPKNDQLTLEQTQYGGHCGFLVDYALNSWIDQRLLQLINAQTQHL